MEESKKVLEKRLETLVIDLEVPESRKDDARWLLRNAHFNNSNHPRLTEVIDTAKKLVLLETTK